MMRRYIQIKTFSRWTYQEHITWIKFKIRYHHISCLLHLVKKEEKYKCCKTKITVALEFTLISSSILQKSRDRLQNTIKAKELAAKTSQGISMLLKTELNSQYFMSTCLSQKTTLTSYKWFKTQTCHHRSKEISRYLRTQTELKFKTS